MPTSHFARICTIMLIGKVGATLLVLFAYYLDDTVKTGVNDVEAARLVQCTDDPTSCNLVTNEEAVLVGKASSESNLPIQPAHSIQSDGTTTCKKLRSSRAIQTPHPIESNSSTYNRPRRRRPKNDMMQNMIIAVREKLMAMTPVAFTPDLPSSIHDLFIIIDTQRTIVHDDEVCRSLHDLGGSVRQQFNQYQQAVRSFAMLIPLIPNDCTLNDALWIDVARKYEVLLQQWVGVFTPFLHRWSYAELSDAPINATRTALLKKLLESFRGSNGGGEEVQSWREAMERVCTGRSLHNKAEQIGICESKVPRSACYGLQPDAFKGQRQRKLHLKSYVEFEVAIEEWEDRISTTYSGISSTPNDLSIV